MDSINENLSKNDLEELNKVNLNLVKEAVAKLKANKSDPIWDFSADFLKASPDILYHNLAEVIKSFLVHGYVS